MEENLHHRYHVSCNERFYNDCIGPRRFARVNMDKEAINVLDKIAIKFG